MEREYILNPYRLYEEEHQERGLTMIPLPDNEFNRLSWEQVDGQKVDSLITGLKVVGAESISYPVTDGLIIYLKDTKGNITVLDIGADIYTEDLDKNPFYITIARI